MTVYESAIKDALKIPRHLRRVVDACNTDLFSGPLYLDREGNYLTCFDEGAHPFNFTKGCALIQRWAEERLPPVVWYETWSGCIITNEPEWDEEERGDYYALSYRDVARALFGRELAEYVT